MARYRLDLMPICSCKEVLDARTHTELMGKVMLHVREEHDLIDVPEVLKVKAERYLIEA